MVHDADAIATTMMDKTLLYLDGCLQWWAMIAITQQLHFISKVVLIFAFLTLATFAAFVLQGLFTVKRVAAIAFLVKAKDS